MRRRRSSLEASGQENSRDGARYASDVGLDICSEANAEEKHSNSNTYLKKMTSTVGSSPSRKNVGLQHYRRFYFLHSAFVLMVVVLGMIHNGGDRKYIPVNPKELFTLASSQTSASGSILGGGTSQIESCRKAYVNVHSSTIDEELSAICCFDSNDSYLSNEQKYQSNLCHPRIPIIGLPTQQLPFARRLTRLTEAWVLPLLPILIRLVYQLVLLGYSAFTSYWRRQNNGGNAPIQREATSISSSRGSSSSLSSNTSVSLLEKSDVQSPSTAAAVQSHTPNNTRVRTTLLRLFFYLVLLNFRGWGLYIGANAVEDYVILPWLTGNTVVSPMRTNSMSDEEHDLRYSGNNEPDCWYKDILKAHHRSAMENDGHSDCYGRPFDFSDHVVLFLAHYLPVFLMEMSLYYSYPFWGSTMMEQSASKPSGVLRIICDAIHAFLFLYLHVIVLHALFLTSVYFHTPAEILVGYVVSLMLQLPTIYLMCSENALRVRKYFGLPSEGKSIGDKGD